MTELNDADLPPLPAPDAEPAGGKYHAYLPQTTQAYARQAIKDYLAKQEVVAWEAKIRDVALVNNWRDKWRPLHRSEVKAHQQSPVHKVRSLIVKEELK